jgi:hypothetical protein
MYGQKSISRYEMGVGVAANVKTLEICMHGTIPYTGVYGSDTDYGGGLGADCGFP